MIMTVIMTVLGIIYIWRISKEFYEKCQTQESIANDPLCKGTGLLVVGLS